MKGRKLLQSKQNSKTFIGKINSRAEEPLTGFIVGVIDWVKNDVKELDRTTRKSLTMYGGHDLKADISLLLLGRQQGGRGLITVEECVQMEMKSLLEYYIATQKNHERQLRKNKQRST